MKRTADAVIVGAGIVGVTTALALTNAGFKVVIVDRGSVANGTTGSGEGNILVSDKEPGAELELAMRSRDGWFELALDVGDLDESGGFELEAKGGVVVSRSEDGLLHLLKLAQEQSKVGIDTRALSPSELLELEPNLSKEIPGGVWYPQDAQCQPMLAAAKIMRVFRSRGGEFHRDTAVRKIRTQAIEGDLSVTGVETDQGDISTPLVVNATGTWAGDIAKMARSSLPIAPRRGFILVSVPAPHLIFHKVYDADYVANVASGAAELQSSAVVEGTRSGTILIGASRERVGFNSDLNVAILRQLAAQAIELFPILATVQLLRAYSGFRPFAPDHLPVIGEDATVKGLWHNVGHEGAGIGLSPASAQLIVEMITGQKTFMNPSAFSPGRFGNHE